MEIAFSFDKKSTRFAIRKLKAYKKWFDRANELFVKELAEAGIPVAVGYANRSQGDADKNFTIYFETGVNVSGVSIGKIVFQGKDVAFIEFGSGIHYMSSETEGYAKPKGYGVGTFNPSSDNWSNPNGWWYTKDGEHFHSYGQEGTMPLGHAASEIIIQVREIAQRCFNYKK